MIGFIIVGFCIGMAVGMGIMLVTEMGYFKDVGDTAHDAINKVGAEYRTELKKAYTEIERMQDTINKLQIERAKTMAKAEGFKDIGDAVETAMLTDYKPDWLKDFLDVNNNLPDGPEFGGITL